MSRKTSSSKTLKGVNLGGWLLLEKWMTPSLFKGTEAKDEYTFMLTSGAADKIDRHRKSFITEADFKWLKDNHIDIIRLPVGYWVLESSGPYIEASKYLDFAVDMAEKYQLKLLIDLHGAPGSQNGHDHSGRIGKSRWYKERLNQLQTIDVLEGLARRYYDRDCVWGYQLLNEPKLGLIQWRLRRYYRQAYRRLIEVARPGTSIVFHDAFTTFLMSGAVKREANYPVVIDRHWYHFLQVGYQILPLSWYFAKLKLSKYYYSLIRRSQPLIIGEWSGVISHRRLRGVSKEDKRRYQIKHIEEQLKLYEHTDGWFYWSYKTENKDFWNFRHLVKSDIIKLK